MSGPGCIKGPGHDDFSPPVLRWVSKEISALLSRLINACLGAGFFPGFLKVDFQVWGPNSVWELQTDIGFVRFFQDL